MYRTVKYLLAIFILFGFAQDEIYSQSDLKAWQIPFFNGSDSLLHSTAGGLNCPQFSEIDLNNDGIKDLLVYDRSARKALTFINKGLTGQVSYEYAPEYEAYFPQNVRFFMLARDYDGDGIEDLFFFNQPPSFSGGIGVMKGSYLNGQIRFTTVSDLLFSTGPYGYQHIFIINGDLPAIRDADGDGDLDIASFNMGIFPAHVHFYENLSADLGYGMDSLIFNLETECYGLFSEYGASNAVELSNSIQICANASWWGRPQAQASPRDPGSSLEFIDWNKDGSMDLLMGDIGSNSLNLLTGHLLNDTILTIAQDSTFPSYNQAVDLFSFPAAFLVDLNNDGKKDLLASPMQVPLGQAVSDSVAHMYENMGQQRDSFLFRQKDFLVGEMIDLGTVSRPIFVDVNQDSLMDLIVGHWGLTNPVDTYTAVLTYYKNIGTADQPKFRLEDSDFADLSSLQKYALHPTFGDLDGDGDQDLLLGLFDGSLVYFENIAASGQMMNFTTPQFNYENINLNADATPQLMDMDRDGDLDIMSGSAQGYLYYFENIGTANNPSFNSSPTSNTFGFDLTAYGANASVPFFVDTGSDFELYLGNSNGEILKFNHIENNILGVYDTLSLNFEGLWEGRFSSIALADIDNDDTLDVVMGNVRGGIAFYNYNIDEPSPISSIEDSKAASNFSVFPNPAENHIWIRWDRPTEDKTQARLYDALGRVLFTESIPAFKTEMLLRLPELSEGLYFLEVQEGERRQLKTLRKR